MRETSFEHSRAHKICLALLVATGTSAVACQAKTVDKPTAATTPVAQPRSTEPTKPPPPQAPPVKDTAIRTVSLSGDAPVAVPRTELTAHISGAWHKTRAPLVGVSILVSRGSESKAEVSWRIESGNVDSQWIAVSGSRYDAETSSHKDEEIAGWQVRLDSIDDSSSGGNPTAITVSFRRAP